MGIGGGGDGIFEKIQKWFQDTEIVQRTAIMLLALVFIGGALAIFAFSSKNDIAGDIAGALKGK